MDASYILSMEFIEIQRNRRFLVSMVTKSQFYVNTYTSKIHTIALQTHGVSPQVYIL